MNIVYTTHPIAVEHAAALSLGVSALIHVMHTLYAVQLVQGLIDGAHVILILATVAFL